MPFKIFFGFESFTPSHPLRSSSDHFSVIIRIVPIKEIAYLFYCHMPGHGFYNSPAWELILKKYNALNFGVGGDRT
eukprot:1327721-Amorphochlora_amoeboformis.AAC.1